MSLLICTDRIWDLSQPTFHDRPASRVESRHAG